MAEAIQPIPVNPSPKSRFLTHKDAIMKHRDLIVRPEFQLAIDHALLEYISSVAANTEPQVAISGHYKSVGALEFVSTLKTLAETKAQMKFDKPTQLDHTV